MRLPFSRATRLRAGGRTAIGLRSTNVVTSASEEDGVESARFRLTELVRRCDEGIDKEISSFKDGRILGGSTINFPRLQDVKTGSGIACRVTVII